MSRRLGSPRPSSRSSSRTVWPLSFTRRGVAATLVCIAMIGCAACNRATILRPSINDSLREENQSLRDEIGRLQLQASELRSRLAEAERADARTAGGAAKVDPEVEAAIPRLAAIQIDGATELVSSSSGAGSAGSMGKGDSSADATEEILRLWINPRDGRGRFLQIVGRLTVSVAILRAGSKPESVATATFGPSEVRDAWRSGFMGSHYAFSVPLSIPAEFRNEPVTVSVRFDDALSGRIFEDQARVRPARREGARVGLP